MFQRLPDIKTGTFNQKSKAPLATF
ncbi:uncharacterized protein METZ01_LOCUS78355 [marine metagenome]|uniref:Uncharacterized protein n=1 Tax=marine metagenome TaxID=408172 RepID=A0A381UCN7_9ZZZZ